MLPADHRPGTRLLAVLVVMCALVVGFLLGAYTRALHFSYAFSAYDVGMHLQALWRWSHGGGLFNTIRGLNYWGDHLWIAYSFLAPVYRLWPSATLVYFYQGFGLAAGGLAVYGIARARLHSRLLALVPVVLYWGYPGLIHTAQENFHPEAIGSTWLLLVLWAEETDRPGVFWTAAALALLTKEDIALYMLGVAAFTWLRGHRGRGILLGVVSVVYFGVALKVLLPFFNGVGFFRMRGGYWFSDWAANAFNPSFYTARFVRPDVRAYIWDLFWPVAFLPLGHPIALFLLAGPALFVNQAGGAYLVSVHYHYLYGIIPGLFLATVLTLASLEGLASRLHFPGWLRWVAGTVVAAAVLFPTVHGQMRTWDLGYSYGGMARRLTRNVAGRETKIALLEDLMRRLPYDSVVSASHNLVPMLANRDGIFMFPNPWKVMYWGIEGENQASPDVVDTILLDTGADGADLTQLAREVIGGGGWEIEVDEQQLLVARRVVGR